MPMTKQEVFDTVATHLLTQKAVAMDVHGSTCMYRGTEGRKCAVGCLIPDEVYEERFEKLEIGGTFPRESWHTPELFKQRTADQADLNHLVSMIHEDLGFLRELQKVHDRDGVVEWYTSLKNIAEDHSLSTEVLETL